MVQRSFWALAFFTLLFLTQCHKAQTVGLFTQSDPTALNVFNTDTFSIITSTVAMDSVPTFDVGKYNDSAMLVGQAIDPFMGTANAKCFFQINGTNSGNKWDLSAYSADNQVHFDSIVLYLKYNHSNLRYEDFGVYTPKTTPNPNNTYYQTYGDTTQVMTLQLFQLTHPLLKNQVVNTSYTTALSAPYFYNSILGQVNPQGLFNTSSASYDKNSVYASVQFLPHPRSEPDSLTIRLPDTLGQNLLKFAQTSDSKISTDLEFAKYFKGLVLTVPNSTRASILNFSPRQSKIKLYFKQNQYGTFVNKVHLMDINYAQNAAPDLNNTLFNQIQVDRTGTPLAGIKPFTPIPVTKTGNTTYIQSGNGLMTKIQFPYLQSFFLQHPNLVVNKAELIIQNKINTYGPGFRLPTYLQLYVNNLSNLNVPIGILSQDFTPSLPQTALREYIGGVQFGYYHFYITQYLGSQLYKPYYDGAALFLGTPVNSMENSLDRMLINNPLIDKNSIKLRLFFTQTNTN